VDRLPGATVVEFGTPWCGHCQRAQPLIETALKDRADIAHVKVEDGPGQRLGRTFGVKLWPTLVFMKDGKEVARLVRPQSGQELQDAVHAEGDGDLRAYTRGTQNDLTAAPHDNKIKWACPAPYDYALRFRFVQRALHAHS